jgi:hypothetical protein
MTAHHCFHGRKDGRVPLSFPDSTGELVFDCPVLVLEHVAGQIAGGGKERDK